MKYLVTSAAIFFLFASPLYAEPDTLQKRLPAVEKKVADLEKEVTDLKREIGYLKLPPIPDQLSLCDHVIPLPDEEVREDFEREFYQLIESKGLLTVLVKRYSKFFTVVSEELNREEMPSDLIYLAIAESYLNPRANSKANAGGIWQFIKDTAKKEGLLVNDTIDERYSVTRSTTSALTYLKKLHDEFNDWFIAMAAYNAGEARLRDAIANQNTKDFFDLFLPEETARYVFRIAAIKEIVGNPRKYGLSIERSDYYRPYAVTEVTLELDRETHTAILAQAMELPYKTFREYNLHIRKYRIPRGVYHLYVPIEKKDAFLRGIRNCPGATLQ